MPSTGVGYEIATARYRYRIPVICLYRPAHTTRCTAMVAGDRGIELIEYSEVADLLPRLTSALAKYTAPPSVCPHVDGVDDALLSSPARRAASTPA